MPKACVVNLIKRKEYINGQKALQKVKKCATIYIDNYILYARENIPDCEGLMLERMAEFFENRIDSYDDHMLTAIESADEFYSFTARSLPTQKGARILDLGCGTGLELEYYYRINPTARITGIDLSEKMLERLKAKFPEKEIELLVGSYFDLPFEREAFDGAVSVESLHHFTKEEKIPLYKKLCESLAVGACFILTDYFASSDEEEMLFASSLNALRAEEGITSGFYHYDTPLTVEHESEALLLGGFSSVEILSRWGATYTIRANK